MKNGYTLIKLCDLPKNLQSYVILDGVLYTCKVPWGNTENVGLEARARLVEALLSAPPVTSYETAAAPEKSN